MNKLFFLCSLGLAVLAQSANADIIRCEFTEPFYSTEYSMDQQSLTITGVEASDAKVIKNVSFQIKGAGVFDLIGKDGKVIQELRLTNKGSDGMSDAVYPYDVTWFGMQSFANNGIGGCTSNFLRKSDSGAAQK